MPTYDAEWHDMSDYVVHFTRDYGGRRAYDNMLSILAEGRLRARNPFGIARRRAPPSAVPQVAVCFSEIPLDLVSRLAGRRGDYGIGFTKSFLLDHGGGPVWYVEHGGPTATALNELMAIARSGGPTGAVWAVTPFVDSPGNYPTGTYRFEWEREWRHVGDLAFGEDDPAFLMIPETLHDAAREFFDNARAETIGPSYACPFLDPHWTREMIEHAFRNRP